MNLFLFTGINAFALREERRRWAAEFAQKHGSQNFLETQGERVKFRELLDEVSTAPFIGGKRLVVVHGIPKFTKEEVDVLKQSLHPDCVLLFSDPQPDKRLQGVKALMAVATVKEFPALAPRQLVTWMQTYASSHGASMDQAACELLVRITGSDQDMLAREIEKLAAGQSAISSERVTLLAVPSGEQEVWTLSNFLARGDHAGALRYGKLLLAHGEDAYSLWNILLWLVRSLSAVALAASEGQNQPAKIASSAGVPFPTAKNLLPLASRVKLSALHDLLDWAVAADRELKTGGYRATAEAPQELQSLIDALILKTAALTAESRDFQFA